MPTLETLQSEPIEEQRSSKTGSCLQDKNAYLPKSVIYNGY